MERSRTADGLVGCSPTAVNLLLDGPDNLVCKLYPITIRRIGPNVIEGEERLITTQSGTFDWPGSPASVRLYQYDEYADLINRDAVVRIQAAGKLPLVVPAEGLVIAEAISD